VSVDKTVEIPNLLARRDARVDLPVPDVPPSNMITGKALSDL